MVESIVIINDNEYTLAEGVGEKTDYTSLEESVESHLIGIKAEESRLSGGILKYIR